MRFDVCIIGHITKDIVKIGREEKRQVGGTVYYCSVALRSLGLSVAVVTKLAKEDVSLLDELKRMGIKVFYKAGRLTTTFENIYREGKRFQRIRSIAEPFEEEDVPSLQCTIFHLGPLTSDEFSPPLIEYLASEVLVSLDIQGLLRKVEEKVVKLHPLSCPSSILSNVGILKADEEEAKVASGERNLVKAALRISEWGPKEVIITLGKRGSLVFAHGKIYSIPAFLLTDVVDPTGCGDTYMAGYLYKKVKGSSDFDEIGRFSAAISALKLKGYGAYKGGIKEISSLLEKKV